MWRAYKAAGRPWPQLDTDEVIDYQIMEALAAKEAKAEKEAAKQAKVDAWRKDKTELHQAVR